MPKSRAKCIWSYKVSYRDWQGVLNKHIFKLKTLALRQLAGAVQKGYKVTMEKVTEDEI